MNVNIIVSVDENIDANVLSVFIAEKCRQEGIDFDLRVEGRAGRELVTKYKNAFNKPIEVGRKLALKVLTARTKRFGFEPYENDRIIVEIEPKSSFGTGVHETTRLCLEALESYIKDGYTVLDIGCGTGILSVSSLLLGAKSAVAVDFDKRAVENARDTAERNGVADRYTAIHGKLADNVEEKFDLIVANILTDQIKELLQGIKTHLNDDGVLILSGIVDFRLDEVIEAAKDFEVINTRTNNNWCCIELKPSI